MTRVLVVDDEPQVTHALSRALSREGYDVLVAADGERAVDLAATSEPHLMIVDLSLPGLNGLEVIKRVRSWSQCPILVLSGVTQELAKVQALDAGADDYLQKPFGLDELHARLRALERRAAPAEETSGRHDFEGLQVNLVARTIEVGGAEARLTPTEWRLLEELVTHPEQLLTHRWLLQRVWDSSHGDETRDALRAHVRSLRAKIGDDAHAPRFIRTESGAGYRWVGVARTAETVLPDWSEAVTGEQDAADLAAVGTRELVHELNNSLTAMRMAVQLMRMSDGEATEDSAAMRTSVLERLDGLARRISVVAVALESRVGDQKGEDLGAHPGR
ncbi:response regulator transcription factor [Nocardioides psychrotolerans]|uniref:response regulator transcription factor n=1 Tax=Nocardioides psychrotolerans TaxID=1005945 RepID=UPI003137DDFA